MQDQIRKQILDAFLLVLRPAAKILLRYGIGFREFSEIAKVAFVDVATKEYGIRGRPTNISRVAVMTGLTRKEVRRIRDQIEGGTAKVTMKSTPLTRILHRWYSEDEFLESDGTPSVLPFVGEQSSFTSLVKRFGGDIPPGAMRTELRRVGAIEEQDSGHIKVLRRDIRPDDQHDNLCVAISHGLYAHMSNVEYNTRPDRSGAGWGQKTAYTAEIRVSDVARIRRICEDRIDATAESFDDLFMAYEKIAEDEIDPETFKAVAVTICYFEESDQELMSLWRE